VRKKFSPCLNPSSCFRPRLFLKESSSHIPLRCVPLPCRCMFCHLGVSFRYLCCLTNLFPLFREICMFVFPRFFFFIFPFFFSIVPWSQNGPVFPPCLASLKPLLFFFFRDPTGTVLVFFPVHKGLSFPSLVACFFGHFPSLRFVLLLWSGRGFPLQRRLLGVLSSPPPLVYGESPLTCLLWFVAPLLSVAPLCPTNRISLGG